ncbi:hypothetical protein LTR37_007762 [Vermiconidia calcicola]|uniref:Uncharacterized protein n=1 Tax=Vermiconidia calcicola TaxID=1690605 RepID=A0ACC3NE21_9PEZI|nr:hypothetical protein LTR37_007762 [Vermiconidia calcicola]
MDHFGFSVQPERFEVVVKWYLAALAPLNYEKLNDYGKAVGLGANKLPDFWISCGEEAPSKPNLHIAFKASDHDTVDAFYDAALTAGGTDNGKPGIRSMYHPNYYGTFVLDPVGNNVEVVDHGSH